jgi:predicted SAM-dependent methyltransferase
MTVHYLNLGCGSRFHPDWENVDFVPAGPSVRVHDLLKPIPYADQSFDVVYHSHVLEHFPREQGLAFLRECYRLLRPGGVIRVAVPDLERIARLYLEALEKATDGIPGWADKYGWMVMEMYDQTVRERSGGGLVEYLNRDPSIDQDFVIQRWGVFAIPMIQAIRANVVPKSTSSPPAIAWTYVLRNPGKVLRDKLLKLILTKRDWEALLVGRFRRGGEVHMWMYDFYSLGKLLEQAGFRNGQRVGPAESKIPGWSAFHLDTEPDGRTYKADSMYVEALKPSTI